MNNTIAERILDFLKNFPPFDSIEHKTLLPIAQKVKVIYKEEGAILFEQNQQPPSYFYVVKEGAIGLYRIFENDTILVDICDEGDLLGLRPLVHQDSYRLSAKAKEESIIYAISVEQLKKVIETNPKVDKYITVSFSTNIKTLPQNSTNNTIFNIINKNDFSEDYIDTQVITANKPVSCNQNTSIKEAAIEMATKNVGSIVITKNKKPIGIITDKDFRTKIVTGKNDITQKVDIIMSSPVITFSKNITTTEAQLAMMRHKIKHLCITKDGTETSDLIGVISEHDIIMLSGNSPLILIKQLNRAKTPQQLVKNRKKASQLTKNYIAKNVPIDSISRILSEINDLIIQKAIEFSINEMPKKPVVPFAWLSIGSQGRGEQLLLTDQDNILVFKDVEQSELKTTQAYFLELAKKISYILNQVGYEYCPAEMMASNPRWCMSETQWKQQFKKWITTPTEKSVMMCNIFFDYKFIYGNYEMIEKISESIFKSIKSYQIFLNFLAQNALLNPPPIGFFRQFIVENSGENKDQFDIKVRALMPIIDAARLLILDKNVKGKNNTISRLQYLMENEPQNRNTYLACIDAFKILVRFKTEQGIKNNDTGRYLNLSKLSKIEKLKLKSCFKPVKEIQELIKIRFNLVQL